MRSLKREKRSEASSANLKRPAFSRQVRALAMRLRHKGSASSASMRMSVDRTAACRFAQAP
jgi:hypothetical protein